MKINKLQKKLDSMLTESINYTPNYPKKKVLNEGNYNNEILDFIDTAQSLFNKLSKDRNVNTKVTKQLFTKFRPVFDLLHSLTETNELKEDGGSSDETLMFYINTYPWYFQKVGDSTHFKMANNEKALKSGAAMVHHVGQHRGEDYYKDLVNWLHNKVSSRKLNKKQYSSNQ